MSDIEQTPMFCYQCEQTVRPTGCIRVGVCSKSPLIAAKQDAIMAGLKSLSLFYLRLKEYGLTAPAGIPEHIAYSFFVTLTNTNFDLAQHDHCLNRIEVLIHRCKELIAAHEKKATSDVTVDHELTNWTPSWPDQKNRIDARNEKLGKTVVGLQEMIIYGLKGLCAYAFHAIRLNHCPEDVLTRIPDVLAFVAKDPQDIDALVKMSLHVGTLAHRTMETLDRAHNEIFGPPQPTTIMWGPLPGKCILVSGHDLLDLQQLLEQTAGKGINVFTHGEMMPCHGYPALRAYKHFVGHYGTAWQNQNVEFAAFPGPVLMTTNCLVPPTEKYRDRIWATGPVGFPGMKKVEPAGERGAASALMASAEKREGTEAPAMTLPEKKGFFCTDFSPIIEQALSLPGFPDDLPTTPVPPPAPEVVADMTQKIPSIPDHTTLRSITVGFGHRAVVPLLPHVIDSAKSGKLRRIFVMGGCDGYEPSRSYFTDLARIVPQDCAIITLACGRFRFHHLGLDAQKVPGTQIPRLMDCGQCNDSFSAATIAITLAKELGCSVSELPLTICLSWFEQKAVADLLALLSLGFKNITIGPRPPAFLSQDSLELLNKVVGLKLTSKNPQDDLPGMLA